MPAVAVAAPPAPLPRYGLNAYLDYDAGSLVVGQQVTFTNVTGEVLDRAVFRTFLGAKGALSLTRGRVDGQDVAATFDQSGSIFELILPAPLADGQATTIELDWSASLPRWPDRSGMTADVVSLGNWYPMLTVYRSGWDRRPFTDIGDAVYTEMADVDLRLDLSREAAVAYTGDLVVQDGPRWEIAARGVRDLALAVSPAFTRADVWLDEDTLVSAYTLDPALAQPFADATAEFARMYERLVGGYPYASLQVAQAAIPASFAGLEFSRLMFVAPGVSAANFERSAARDVIGHEVAHQWFYALVGDDQLADPWLDEALATAVSLQVYEEVAPALAARSSAKLDAAFQAGPIDQGVFDFRADSPYFDTVYNRGARFLRAVRQSMGDEAWAGFLQQMLATYQGKVATPRAVLDLAQRSAPASDLQPLIAAYTRYGAWADGAPLPWSVTSPGEGWAGVVPITVETAFPVTLTEVWLDGRLVASAAGAGTLWVDTGPIPAGEYVLLVRLTDEVGAWHERSRRVQVLG